MHMGLTTFRLFSTQPIIALYEWILCSSNNNSDKDIDSCIPKVLLIVAAIYRQRTAFRIIYGLYTDRNSRLV